MATYQILYWHDLPVQVRAKGTGRDRVSVQLSQRFQDAVDSAAMAAGLSSGDGYMGMFQWGEETTRDGDVATVAHTVAAETEAAYPDAINWRATVDAIKGQ